MIRIPLFSPAAWVACALALALPGAAPRATAATTSYALNVPPSSFVWGCGSWGPCLCAEVDNPTYGSFDLTFVGSDPLYDHYTVDRYIASFNNGPGAIALTGSGTYKIGGEFALTQEMTLDLSLFGGPVQHFDSGIVPVSSGTFPKLHAACAAHGFACYDTVVTVDAAPIAVAGGPRASPRPSGIAAVQPNPFAGATSIVWSLERPGPVELTVLDLAGRRVRQLVPRAASEATGGGTIAWDGRRDDGTEARAGVYWVRLRWAGGSDARRLIKLE